MPAPPGVGHAPYSTKEDAEQEDKAAICGHSYWKEYGELGSNYSPELKN